MLTLVDGHKYRCSLSKINETHELFNVSRMIYLALLLTTIYFSAALGGSLNHPDLCSNATWATNGTIIYNTSGVVGDAYLHAIFITKNNEIYLPLGNSSKIYIKKADNSSYTQSWPNVKFHPHSIFVSNNGTLFLDNAESGEIHRIDSNNNSQRIPIDKGKPCHGLAVDINETIYCSILENSEIWKASIYTNVSSSWMNVVNNTSLYKPQGIFVDDNLTLYVADTDAHRIRIFSLPNSPSPIRSFSGSIDAIELKKPTDFVLDKYKRMYIVNNDKHQIVAIDPNPNPEKRRCIIACNGSSGFGTANDQLRNPIGIAFDSVGNIYVTDSNNSRVLKFDYQPNSCGVKDEIGTSTSIMIRDTMKVSGSSLDSTNLDPLISESLSTEIRSNTSPTEKFHQTDINQLVLDTSIFTSPIPIDFFSKSSQSPPYLNNTMSSESNCSIPVDPCTTLNPCLNYGTCTNNSHLPQLFSCSCSSNYTGIFCQIDKRICQSNTCYFNGTCIPMSPTEYQCLCTHGRTGRHCEKRIDYCHNVTCQNKGLCQSTETGPICRCLSNRYSGPYCEFAADDIVLRQFISKSFAYIAIIALTVVGIFVITMDVLKYGFGIDPVESERIAMRRGRALLEREGPRKRQNLCRNWCKQLKRQIQHNTSGC